MCFQAVKSRSIQSARLSLQSSELSPTRPLTRKRVLLHPPLVPGGGGDTLAGGSRGLGSQFGRWDRHSDTLGNVLYNPSTSEILLFSCIKGNEQKNVRQIISTSNYI
jgi:hypothetical protein